MTKKAAPVLIVIGLILVVGIVGVVSMMINRYTPTSKTEDLNAYYGLVEEGQAALIINDEISDTPGIFRNEEVYISYDSVQEKLDTNFYWDEVNQQMMLTLADGIRTIMPGDQTYATESGAPALIEEGGTYYLAVDFIQEYTDMDCATYTEPARAVIRTRWSNLQQVTVTKDTAVRVKGGIKSKVLQKTVTGEKLMVMEQLDNWTKVSTLEGSIGYVENKSISKPEAAAARAENKALEFPAISRDYKINLGWHQVTTADGNAGFPEIVSNATGLTTISPTWFKLEDNEGAVSSIASKEYVDQAHAMGLEVWGLVDNFSENVTTAEVLADIGKRTRIIEQLLAAAEDCGMDGINVDFEQLTEDSIPHFLQFLRELTIKAHEKNLVVSVDNLVPQNYNMYYKRGTQGKIVDYVIIMGYDEHYSGSEKAGSVASLPFVESGIKRTLEEVPASKVINAIPFYTRVWTETFGQERPTSEVLGMDGADSYIQEHQMTKEWDPELGQNVAISEDDSARYTIWVEDEQSIEEKMKVIQSHGLAGVAEWRLGLERNTVWEIINRYLQ
ncbi:MAG TPA: glycosyl hydrolase family 18 [Candidatus Pelethocola excrementipullorum]|nr:glycosyl hydrolase family 18 [Candidatus Pelethocola excrementipullorum]